MLRMRVLGYVYQKMQAMKLFRKYNFKKIGNIESIFCSNDAEVKLGYVNINDFFAGRSIEFLNENLNLLALDVLIVADTRLGNETDEIVLEEKLSNWIVDARFDSEDKIKHMCMLVLKSKKLDHK